MSTFRDASGCAGMKMVIGESARGKLMSIVNGAGLVLDGIVFSPPNARLAIVHVHGSLGNFYQQPFIRVFANRLARHGIAVLSFNLTGHDGVSEGYTPDQCCPGKVAPSDGKSRPFNVLWPVLPGNDLKSRGRKWSPERSIRTRHNEG